MLHKNHETVAQTLFPPRRTDRHPTGLGAVRRILDLLVCRQSDLVNQQKNILSQVTHELKSPLASIQLHIETIKLRKPPADKLERFLDTMLADTDRLNNLISNLLMAAKLEHRTRTAQ